MTTQILGSPRSFRVPSGIAPTPTDIEGEYSPCNGLREHFVRARTEEIVMRDPETQTLARDVGPVDAATRDLRALLWCSIDELAAERDEVLLGLIELRNKVAKSSQTKSTEPVA